MVARTCYEEFAANQPELRLYVLGEYKRRTMAQGAPRRFRVPGIRRDAMLHRSVDGPGGGPARFHAAELGRRIVTAGCRRCRTGPPEAVAGYGTYCARYRLPMMN